VAQKLMHLIKDEKDDLFMEILPNFETLSMTEKGLNVMKRFILELKSESAQVRVVDTIMKSCLNFLENFYCNYATQLIIKTWAMPVIAPLFTLIVGKIEQFSLQKSSSNVVEVMLCHCAPDMRKLYFKELASSCDLNCTDLT
jgi:hypothetical protein